MPRRQDEYGSGRSADWRPHDTDRSIDPFDDRMRSTRPPSSRPAVPPPSGGASSRTPASRGAAPARQPARPSPGGGRVDLRTVLLAGGGLLAVVATVLVFLTDDPDMLRVAVVAVAWAFVLATFVAGRRRGEQAASAGREAALRRTYEQELEREVAARREYELELENDLRREAEDSMRSELDALRGELSGLTELRREVAKVAELREDVAGLSALRDEVARMAALRDDVLPLTALRTELAQLGELRSDLGRLRTELVEQLSSEMLVERIVMRTQGTRLSAGEPDRLDAPSWRDDPPRELTGGWPAVRLDEQSVTQQYERVQVDRPAPRPWEPTTGGLTAPAPPPPYAALSQPFTTPSQPVVPPAFQASPQPTPTPEPVRAEAEPPVWTTPGPTTEAYSLSLPPRSRHAAEPEPSAEPAPSPLEWLASSSLLDSPGAELSTDDPGPRRRRTDGDVPSWATPDDVRTTERPAAGYSFGEAAPAPSGNRDQAPGGHSRLDEILAESGVQPASGSRRRRRYRDEDGSDDDVLSRVLRGN
jgi:hypothetical protein